MARRRGGRRRRRGRRMVRRGYGGKKRVIGGMLRGRMHPPSNSASPWNNCVVTFQWMPATGKDDKDFVTIQTLSATSVREQLSAELGLKGDVDMRILRVDAWTQPQISNSTRNTIVMAPVDWTACGSAVINWYESWGTSVQPAHVHYVWPRSITNVVIPNANNCAIVKFDVRDKSFAYIIKVHLIWRKSQPNPMRLVMGITSSLRDPRSYEPPPPDDYEVVIQESAYSPLARVVDAFSLRT